MSAKPSQETGAYWVFAREPGREKPDEGRGGKWLVFVPAGEVDAWWENIKRATEAGSLGPVAKAATARHNTREASPGKKVICVYTRDWKDRDDVRRVLNVLRGLGVSWKLAYKTDAATCASRYGRGASVYVSDPGSHDLRISGDRLSGPLWHHRTRHVTWGSH